LDTIEIERHGGGWAVKHAGSYLGHASTQQEAVALGRWLVSSLEAEGRIAELRTPRHASAPRQERDLAA
jgi:hypothetical protein